MVGARFSRPLAEKVLSQTRVTALELASVLQELNITYHFGFYGPVPIKKRFYIKRDPVSRFVSCASQKIGQKPFAKIIDIEHLIDKFDELCLDPLRRAPLKPDYNQDWETSRELIVPRHFAPQHLTFGDSTSYYNQCIDVSEVNTGLKPILEEYFQKEIPALVVNKGHPPLCLSDGQRAKVRAIFQRDYEIGYC